MHSRKMCLEALAAGYTLTNNNVYISLDKYGAQIIKGILNHHHPESYTFDDPQNWHIVITKKPIEIPYTLLAVLLTLVFAVAYLDQLKALTTNLQYENKLLKSQVNCTATSLEAYQLLESDIIALGATPELARTTIQAAELYNLNPKP